MKLLEGKRKVVIFAFIVIALNASMIISIVVAQLSPLSLNEPVSVTDSLSLNLNGATVTPIPPDTEKPTISISSPYSGQSFTTSTITASGTAYDNVGLSKVEVKVNSGSWQLASGTTSWSKEVTLSSGTNTIYAKATDTSGNTAQTSLTVSYATFGSISVSSSPSGASIYLDENYQGTTPKDITDVAEGSHTITLKLTGYEDWSQTVNVAAGRTSDVSAPLTPMPTPTVTVAPTPTVTVAPTPKVIVTPTPTSGLTPTPTTSPSPITGSISISSSPSGASINLDGSYQGTTPMTLTVVASGTHTLTLSLKGYLDWSQTFDVVAGQKYSVSPELIPAQPESTTPVPTATPWPDSSNLYLYGIVIIAIILIAIAALKRRGSYQKTKPAETEIIKRLKPSVKPEPEPVKETRQPPIPEEQKLRKCSKCGTEVHTGDRFCEECGEPLGS